MRGPAASPPCGPIPRLIPRRTGLFFGMSRGSYASVEMFHVVTAFRLGPRWSVAYGSTRLGNLFDSSLTSQDPTLATLRAQSAWGRLDATFGAGWLTANIGIGWAGDDNVGVFESSTIARAHLRITPFKTRTVTLGLRQSQVIGGSVLSRKGGRQGVDVTVNHFTAHCAQTQRSSRGRPSRQCRRCRCGLTLRSSRTPPARPPPPPRRAPSGTGRACRPCRGR